MLSEIEYINDLKSSKCFYFYDLNFLLLLMWPEIVFTFFLAPGLRALCLTPGLLLLGILIL